jgi:non-homologous end joining protein Ku
MAPGENWKAFLRLSLVACSPVLVQAASIMNGIRLKIVVPDTGNPVHYPHVDAETGQEVPVAALLGRGGAAASRRRLLGTS